MMKKWLLLALCLCCSMVCAETVQKIELLTSKVILKNADGYFVLSDGSCWKAVSFSKRWRSLSEWWNNVKLVPESYECVPNDWYLGSQIEVYSKYSNMAVPEENASNQEQLKQCTHLLFNSHTKQILFAIALDPGECLARLFDDAHEEGFKEGYSKGKSQVYQEVNQSYNCGYSDGYKVGFAEGYQSAVRNEPPKP